MKLTLTLQNPYHYKTIPTQQQFKKWLTAVLKNTYSNEVTIRIVNLKESAALNYQYRYKPNPTNVLAFPVEAIGTYLENHIGDIVICAPLVRQEAKQQQKKPIAHWAHLTIHGLLHLLGYDHITAPQAKIMEQLEIQTLQTLGFGDPYEHS